MLHKISLITLLVFSLSSFAYLPNVGDTAPDFEIKTITGETFNLHQYKGKQSVYVVYWNTWCHYCMKKIPKLKKVENKFPNEIKIIAINTSRDDSVTETIEFQKRFNTNYLLAFDENEVITDLYNVHGVPTEFIIDINGKIQYRDDVPDDIENYLNTWNTISVKKSQNYYTHLIETVFPQLQKNIFWKTDYSQLLTIFTGLNSSNQG